MHKFLLYVFRLSYIAIEFGFDEKTSFYRWSLIKRKLDKRINVAIFKIVSKTNLDCLGLSDKFLQQFLLDTLSELILRHYKRRLKLYKLCQKIPYNSKNTFIYLSIVYSYYDEFARLISAFNSLRYRYKLNTQELPDKINLSIGFPEHAFSTSAIECGENNIINPIAPFSSFGEYLSSEDYPKLQGCNLISVDEYTRASKINEQDELDSKDNSSDIMSYPRTLISKEKNLKFFFLRFPLVVKESIKLFLHCIQKINYILIGVVFIRKWIRLFSFNELLSNIGKQNINIGYIYVLPFSDVGLLKYDEKISSLLTTYNYGSNIFIPPVYDIHKPRKDDVSIELDDMLSAVPVGAFSLSGKSIGFTNVFTQVNDIKKAVNTKYDCKLPVELNTKIAQQPLLMGYENNENNKSVKFSEYIAIFDVPPESMGSQFARSLTGDKLCSYDIIEAFLSECTNACVLAGYNVLYKPKYSLSNYSKEYRKLIDGFKKKYGDKFFVINPYANIIPVLKEVGASINFPYTSTKLIADAIKLPSTFYIPDNYRKSFYKDSLSQDLLIGKSELMLFLSKISQE